MKKAEIMLLILFSIVFFFMLYVAAQDKKEILTEKSNDSREKPDPDDQAVSSEIKAIMNRFSEKSRIELLRVVRDRHRKMEKKEQKLRSEAVVIEKMVSKIEDMAETLKNKDEEVISKLDSMYDELKNKMFEMTETFNDSYGKFEKEEKEKFEQLVQSFKEMDPENAAEIAERIDRNLAARIFLELPPRNSGAVLEETDPDVAADISHIMAQMEKKKEMERKRSIIDENNQGE